MKLRAIEPMQSVKLVWITPDAEEVISYCARVSNPDNQNNMETAPKLLKYCINQRHWSIFEMANLCIEINTTRGISAQILRHRSFSYQEFCLSGDTKITIKAPGGTIQRVPIKKIYENWGNNRLKARIARCYDPQIERFIEAPIANVYRTGEKPVYRYKIKTSNTTKQISCTKEHKVLTKEKGFVDFGIAYSENLSVALNGLQAEPLPYQRKEVLEEHAWMGSTKFAQEFGIAEVTARKWFRIMGVTPSKPNYSPKSKVDAPFKAKLQSFMKWARVELRQDYCTFCGHNGSKSRLELSHIVAHDGDPLLAFDERNLQTLCASCHRKHDIGVQEKKYGWSLGMTAKWGKIISEEYLGIEETYDIEMDHESHNFVANGIVVHNSSRYQDITILGAPKMPHLRRQDQKNRQNSVDDLDIDTVQQYYRRIGMLFEEAGHLYKEMISNGVAKECARAILPLATPTRLYMNGSIRSWITYLALREKHGTQMEHMHIAKDIKKIFCTQLPTIAEALGGADAEWEI
jgi:thymidylate synthase ThyX